MFHKLSTYSVALLFFVTAPLHAGFFGSSDEKIDGKEYLQKIQQTVEKITADTSASIVYLELSLTRPGANANSLVLNGVFIDEKGHCVTLYLNPEDVGSIKAYIGEEEVSAKIVRSDKINGVTIIKVEHDEKTVPVKFTDTSKLVNGQFVVGVSSTSRNLGFEPIGSFGTLKTIVEGARDFAILGGFDMQHNNDIPVLGMPIFTLDGEMLAVNMGKSAILADAFENAVKKFNAQDKEGKALDETKEPWIGFNYEIISEDMAKALNYPREAVIVTRIYQNSPAANADIKRGDLIVGIDGNKLTRKGIRVLSQVRKWLDPEVGKKATLTILRDSKELTKEIVFDEKFKVTSISIEEFGLTVNDISPMDHYAYQLKIDKGVLVTDIEGGSPAATSTYFGKPLIQRGDVIIEVQGYKINNIQDLRSALEKLRNDKISAVLIRLQRGNQPTSVSLDTEIGQKTKDSGDK